MATGGRWGSSRAHQRGWARGIRASRANLLRLIAAKAVKESVEIGGVMNKAKHIAVWALGIAALLTPIVVWDSYAWRPIPRISGRHDARNDLAHGRFRILGYGLPAKGLPVYIALLRQQYEVEYDHVAGCTVSQETIDYVDAYDEVSAAAINRKFGHDVVREDGAEAFGRPK
jgi:hypothetical protein